jgi:ATP-dependent helicase/nuclease subunit B
MNLATIAAGTPFLPALAAWWSARAAGDPARLADGIFLLPTRRAARELRLAFLAQGDGTPLLLPRITAIGAPDEAPLALAGALSLPDAVSPERRLAVLTRMILALRGANGAPETADRAWLLAIELASLLDEAARAEVDLAAALPQAVGPDLAQHWDVTLRFLSIVTEAWPNFLAEEGLIDVALRQLALIAAQAEAWAQAPPAMPVIAAGATGAIATVARLLRVVAGLPDGLVVLPGLDLDMDEESWAALDDSHPQSGMRGLLAAMGARRDDVRPFPHSSAAAANDARRETLSLALLPGAAIGRWREARPHLPEGLSLLTPADQQEEATAIALILRQALEEPGARAALVTPDRALAGRVAAEMLRFGIVADDSAGEALGETPPAVLLRLLATAMEAGLTPVRLLALLKHPLCAAGLTPADCRAAARMLEAAALRGPAPPPGLTALRGEGSDAFLDRLETCLAPLLALPDPAPADRQLRALIEAGEALAATPTAEGAAILWSHEEGEALAEKLTALLPALALLPAQPLAVLPGLLQAALSGEAVRTRRALRARGGTEHPRVFIWGLLESRLLHAETIVLGGLVEGVWPQAAEPGPWMNRAMRAKVGLPSPEEAVGQSAHDFVSASCAARHAVLSVPQKRNRAPAVPCRWVTRLTALLSGQTLSLPVHPATAWARALDRPDGAPVPARPPAPRPDVRLRPRRLSVTEIETWLADPYAIHAKHILALRKLDPIEEAADRADYGRVVHAALAEFFKRNGEVWPADAPAQLRADMDAALRDRSFRPALAAWWRPRLHRIADWVAEAEGVRRDRLGNPTLVKAEHQGAWEIEAPAGVFQLVARADRIDRTYKGGIAILDYKTGTVPAPKAVRLGLAPQLPLQAAMAMNGGFGADLGGPPAEIAYWKISGGHEAGCETRLCKPRNDDAESEAAAVREAALQAAQGFCALVARFDNSDEPYRSQPWPGAAPRFSDYAGLARAGEWEQAEE